MAHLLVRPKRFIRQCAINQADNIESVEIQINTHLEEKIMMKYVVALFALCTVFEMSHARDDCRCTIEQRVWIRVDNTDPTSRPILYTNPPGASGKHTDYQVTIKRRATDREPLPTGNHVVPWNLWPTSDTE